jgi:hypothetical protein
MSMGELAVMDHTGDTKLVWDSDNADDVAAAKAMFETQKKKGYMAFSVKKNGKPGEVLQTFDPKAEKIIMQAPLAGG